MRKGLAVLICVCLILGLTQCAVPKSAEPKPLPSQVERENTYVTRAGPIADDYIGNTKTEKFHLPSCSYLPDECNQIVFDSKEKAIAAGYVPCAHCNP